MNVRTAALLWQWTWVLQAERSQDENAYKRFSGFTKGNYDLLPPTRWFSGTRCWIARVPVGQVVLPASLYKDDVNNCDVNVIAVGDDGEKGCLWLGVWNCCCLSVFAVKPGRCLIFGSKFDHDFPLIAIQRPLRAPTRRTSPNKRPRRTFPLGSS